MVWPSAPLTWPSGGGVPAVPGDKIALSSSMVLRSRSVCDAPDDGSTIGSVPGVTPIATPQPAQLGKALDLIKTILAPGADGTPPPLGQVNGALGQTIGNLLNGKKTALGLLGAVATPLLTQASTSTALAPVLALLTPAAGLSGFALPIFLGLTAWGVLGKMEKWSQGTAPPPKA